MTLYTATDWLGLLPLTFMLGFALLGLIQLIKRKSIFKVDRSILILGGFYVAVAAAYVFFEKVVINYRPILISGILEASYPSSTTMLVLCVMPTALLQLNKRIRNKALKLSTNIIITAFTVFMVIARLVSGVHWLTDIVGGCLYGLFILFWYLAACRAIESVQHRNQ
jgi:undecaprenyl-diphosphatase